METSGALVNLLKMLFSALISILGKIPFFLHSRCSLIIKRQVWWLWSVYLGLWYQKPLVPYPWPKCRRGNLDKASEGRNKSKSYSGWPIWTMSRVFFFCRLVVWLLYYILQYLLETFLYPSRSGPLFDFVTMNICPGLQVCFILVLGSQQ